MHQNENPASDGTLGGAGIVDLAGSGSGPLYTESESPNPVDVISILTQPPVALETAISSAFAKAHRRASHQVRQQRINARQKKTAERDAVGFVYIDQHVGDDGLKFFSVNFFDNEGGWQEGPFNSYRDAKIEAHKLGRKLGVGVQP